MTNPETQLASFFAKYEPAIAKLGRALRAKLRLDPSAKGSVIIKAEAQKQRARRATKAARPASPRRTAKARR